MKIRHLFSLMFSSILFISIITVAFNGQEDAPQFLNFHDLEGSYLGQKPPGMTPEIFAPGYISTEKRELNSVFTPDGKEFYFSISPGRGYKIYVTKQLEKGWSQPQPVPFSSDKSDVDMCITPDGKRMYFGSTRVDRTIAPCSHQTENIFSTHAQIPVTATSTGWIQKSSKN